MNTEETEKGCVEEICTHEKTLLVLPIYNAYLKKTYFDDEQALRLTFLKLQRRVERPSSLGSWGLPRKWEEWGATVRDCGCSRMASLCRLGLPS